VLLELVEKGLYLLLFLAPSNAEEDIRLLSPGLPDQLRKKIRIMNAHWEDYKLIFTTPNLKMSGARSSEFGFRRFHSAAHWSNSRNRIPKTRHLRFQGR
jgi:hypothetical protein